MLRSAPARLSRTVFLAFSLATVPAWPAVAASPSPSPGASIGGAGDQVVLLGRVVVPRGDSVGEVVVFSGRALIAGVARGDVVVLAGPIVVSGQVSGSVIALNGSVRVLGSAQVAGDVLAHDRVSVAEGARVDGSVRGGVAFTLAGPLRAIGAFVSWLAVAVSTLLLGLAMLLVIPRAMERTALAARSAPWASLGWGVGLALVLPPAAVAAIASVAGLPLGLGVLLALLFLALAGAVVAVNAVGRAIVGPERRPTVAFLTGWGIATAVGLVPYVSGLVFVASSVFGLGVMTIATWRARSPDRPGRHRTGYVPQTPPDLGEAPGL